MSHPQTSIKTLGTPSHRMLSLKLMDHSRLSVNACGAESVPNGLLGMKKKKEVRIMCLDMKRCRSGFVAEKGGGYGWGSGVADEMSS
jgi:hypothetical protein